MISSSPSILSPSRSDALLRATLRGCAAVAGLILVFIFLFLLSAAWPVLREAGPWRFVTDAAWHPAEGLYQLLPMVAGTLYCAAGALLLAVPLGVLSAVFLRFYAPRPLAVVYRRLVELLAGIPSVVYGFWGLVVLVPLIAAWQAPGTSLLAGVWVLALMILPTVALTADAALGAVPRDTLRAAAALGLGRWSTVWRIALPAARAGVLAGVVLAAGRALGETMAVLMVTGNVVAVPDSVFAPLRTLAANIALEMAYAMDLHRAALFVSGLVLAGLVAGLMLLAARLSGESAHASA